MPVAGTAGASKSKRFELNTCEGGYVVLRRMSFGEKMIRRETLGKATVKSDGNRRRGQGGNDFAAEMTLINEAATRMEFSKSIVEHNLTYLDLRGQEVPFDFTNPTHYQYLDGSVGEEIQDLITELNDYEVDDEGKSSEGSTPS